MEEIDIIINYVKQLTPDKLQLALLFLSNLL